MRLHNIAAQKSQKNFARSHQIFALAYNTEYTLNVPSFVTPEFRKALKDIAETSYPDKDVFVNTKTKYGFLHRERSQLRAEEIFCRINFDEIHSDLPYRSRLKLFCEKIVDASKITYKKLFKLPAECRVCNWKGFAHFYFKGFILKARCRYCTAYKVYPTNIDPLKEWNGSNLKFQSNYKICKGFNTLSSYQLNSYRIPVRPCPNFVKNGEFCGLHAKQELKETYQRIMIMVYAGASTGHFSELLTRAEKAGEDNLEAELVLSRAMLQRCVELISKASTQNKVEIEILTMELAGKLQKTMSALANINNKIEITKAITYTQVERLLAGLVVIVNKYIPADEISNFIDDIKALNWPVSPLTAQNAVDANSAKLLELRENAIVQQRGAKKKTVLQRVHYESDKITDDLKDEFLKESILDKAAVDLNDLQ